ncbi:ABC transporter ATP-binding protein [Moorena producens]|uniref:ABC transporter ATP-binding protein n=1 Tax=Moorena producens TaxID=1155739 RepID=UPI003C70EFE7
MTSFKDIVNYYQSYWLQASVSIIATSLFKIFDLVLPYAFGQIISILSNKPLDILIQQAIKKIASIVGVQVNVSFSLWTLVSFIFLISVIRAPMQPWITNWFHWAIPLQARCEQSEKVIKKILTLPLSFYDENNPGRIAGRISRGITSHTWTYPDFAGEVIPTLVKVLGIFLIILVIEPGISIVFILSFITILLFSLRKLRILIRQEDFLDRYIENTESHTSEIITNIKTIKAFAKEEYEFNRQRLRYQREKRVILDRIHRGYVKLVTWQRFAVQISLFVILVWMLIYTKLGLVSLAHFITAITISSMAYSEIEPLSTVAEAIARRYASMIRFHDFMKEPSEITLDKPFPKFVVPSYKFQGKVEFVNVSFGYNLDRPVLKDVSFTIEPCEMVALVGKSGAGKSTLVRLLFRYFKPDAGQILVDDRDLQSLSKSNYLRRLSIVHQEVDVFNGTLLENLVYGNPSATFDQVLEACQVAKVDEFIPLLPNGYQTVVGERGVRLSGGQRQRLGIARALLTQPDLLVFDEATSNLDYESEKAIQLAMQSLSGTRSLLIIAHRLSTIRNADKIVVLHEGRIKEIGKHQELLAKKGLYWQLNKSK